MELFLQSSQFWANSSPPVWTSYLHIKCEVDVLTHLLLENMGDVLTPAKWLYSAQSPVVVRDFDISKCTVMKQIISLHLTHLLDAQSLLMHVAQIKHCLGTVLLLWCQSIVNKCSFIINISTKTIKMVISKFNSCNSIPCKWRDNKKKNQIARQRKPSSFIWRCTQGFSKTLQSLHKLFPFFPSLT